MALTTTDGLALFYSQIVPRGLETPFLLLLLYGIYLLVSAGILIFALRVAGSKISFSQDFPKGVFTIVLRDLIAGPLIIFIILSPLFGILFSFIIWLGILKFMFQITWPQALLAWVASGVIQILLILLVIIPVLFLL